MCGGGGSGGSGSSSGSGGSGGCSGSGGSGWSIAHCCGRCSCGRCSCGRCNCDDCKVNGPWLDSVASGEYTVNQKAFTQAGSGTQIRALLGRHHGNAEIHRALHIHLHNTQWSKCSPSGERSNHSITSQCIFHASFFAWGMEIWQ